MRHVKLLNISLRNYLGVFIILTLFSFGLLFIILQRQVFHSTDEILYNRKVKVIEEIQKDGKLPEDTFRYAEFTLTQTNVTSVSKDVYSDTVIYVSVDNEWDEFRKLLSTVEIGGRLYKYESVVARLETHEIISTIVKSLTIIFVLMVIAFYVATRLMSKKLWSPFYNTIDGLNNFEVDQAKALNLPDEKIDEFSRLNQSIRALTARAVKLFENQKQFIENASHELQSPLAITQSKLEQLIGDPNLTEGQSEIIQSMIDSTQRITRLNRSLLLLSKIENDQYLQREQVSIEKMVDEVLALFEEQREDQRIEVSRQGDLSASISANKVLMDLLLTNLLKNAFVHNKKDGKIRIAFFDDTLTISNTSNGDPIPSDKLFQRFYKNSSRKESWGLGLAMVSKICIINGWPITYDFRNEYHSFTIDFGPKK